MKHAIYVSKRMEALSTFENLRVSIFREFSKQKIDEINEENILVNTIRAFKARQELLRFSRDDNDVVIIG